MQGFALIPYRRQAADFIHGFAVILRVAFLYNEKAVTKTAFFLRFNFDRYLFHQEAYYIPFGR